MIPDTAITPFEYIDPKKLTGGVRVPVRPSITVIDDLSPQQSSLQTTLDYARYGDLDLHSDNDDSRSVWSDGTTLWVGDNTDAKAYGYELAGTYGTRDSAKDIAGVTGASNVVTGAGARLWVGDNTKGGTNDHPLAYAYTLPGLARVSSQDFALRDSNLVGVSINRGMATDGNYMWVTDPVFGVQAFRLFDDPMTSANEYGTKDTSRDISFGSNFGVEGMFTDGETIWGVGKNNLTARAVRLADGTRDTSKDFAFDADNTDAAGIWSNGVTMFVVDHGDDKIYTYRYLDNASVMLTGAPRAGRTLTAHVADAQGVPDPYTGTYQWQRRPDTGPEAEWADIAGQTSASYVVDTADEGHQVRVVATFTDNAGRSESVASRLLTIVPLDYTRYGDLDLHADNGAPHTLWSDGTTLWVGDDADVAVYGYKLSSGYGTRDSANDITSPSSGAYIVTGEGTRLWLGDQGVESGNLHPKTYAYTLPGPAREPDKDFALRNSDFVGVTFNRGMATDGNYLWIADTTKTVQAFRLFDDPGTPANEYGTKDTSRDLSFGDSYSPEGMFTDGETIWAVDSSNSVARALRLSDGTRDTSRDFTLDTDNTDAWGIWSNGITMFVIDQTDTKIYTYRYLASVALTGAARAGATLTAHVADPQGVPDPYTGSFQWQRRPDADAGAPWADIADSNAATYQVTTSDEGHQIRVVAAFTDNTSHSESVASGHRTVIALDYARYGDVDLDSDNDNPRSVWSDGTTLWVGDITDAKAYGYELSGTYGTRDSAKDISGLTLWSHVVTGDSTRLWVGDHSQGGSNLHPLAYAYSLPGLARVSSEDFALRSFQGSSMVGVHINDAMATDGNYMWVADTSSVVQAFRLFDDPMTSADEYGTKDTSRDFSFGSSFNAQGMFTDGETIWGVDEENLTARAVRLADGTRYTSRDVALDPGNANAVGIWFNGVTMFVVDHVDDKIYTYRYFDNASVMLTGAPRAGRTLTAHVADAQGVPDPYTGSFQWQRRPDTDPEAEWADIADADAATYQATTSDEGHQVRVVATFTDNAGRSESVASRLLTIVPLDYTRYGDLDLHADNGAPHTLWSDGTTLWVADDTDTELYAYKLTSDYGTRDSANDVDGPSDDAYIVTGEGTRLWIGDQSVASDNLHPKTYAYTLPGPAREPDKDFALRNSDFVGVTVNRGMATDGNYLWVTDTSNTMVHAFRLFDDPGTHTNEYGTKDTNRDLSFGSGYYPEGMFTDGETIWAVDSSNSVARALRLSDGTRDTSRDFTLDTDNTDAWGIWSNGVTMFVIDQTDTKIYTYRVGDVELSGVPVGGVAHVSAGGYHSCALGGSDADTRVICSGGYAPLASNAAVPDVPTGRHYEMVSAGGFHSCALLDDGAAKCWGNNRFSQAPADRSHSDMDLSYVSIDAGVWHTCAVVSDGTLDCWGRNDDTQLDAPDLAEGLEWIQVSAGGYLGGVSTNAASSQSRTCGLVLDGTVRCWGDASFGLDRVPAAGSGLHYTSVSVGGAQACATRSDGALVCWGNRQTLRSAHELDVAPGATPTQITCVTDTGSQTRTAGPESAEHCSATIAPPTGQRWDSVSAGVWHTCGTTGGEIHCWGNSVWFNNAGKAHHHPQHDPYNAPSRAQPDNARHPSAGYWHTCWVYDAEDAPRVICTGDNSLKQARWKKKTLT